MSRLWVIGLCLGLGMALAAPAADAQQRLLNAPLETVEFGIDDSLRGFVETHLSDPDLWPYVLELNNIATPADVVPGQRFQLPVQQVRAADQALSTSLTAIQAANAQGAQVFAPKQIGEAIVHREQAVGMRETGAWSQVVDLSQLSTLLAAEALEIAIAQRDRAAEAIVSDVQGAVEGRAPAEPRWSGRDLNDILVEFERLRTLSSSTTQITFRDLSRLRLNANSNATIQRMRSDPLTGDEVTKVSLVNGDFYALLNQLSEKTSFEVAVPGIETTTDSGDFWIKNDATGARFVNFDAPALEVTQGGKTTTLGENEGLVLERGRAQTAQVLDSPALVAPALGAVLYSGEARLEWDGFDSARGYWIEVATDAGFNDMQISEWGVEALSFVTPALPPLQYHWRVAALDQLGLPGQWSRGQNFTIRSDTTPPFLTVLAPATGDIVTKASVEVFGASEPQAALTLNGKDVVMGADGSFVIDLPLSPGPNAIALNATDPAGNTSDLKLDVFYRPAATVRITFADSIPRIGDALATRTDEVSVMASTTAAAGAVAKVTDAGGADVVQAVVGADGMLGFTVPAGDAPQDYTLDVLSPGGAREGTATFTVLRDQVPPLITLDLPPPRATDEDVLDLSGSISDAVSLTLNGTGVPVKDGRFAMTIALVSGVNVFDLLATDAVGNLTALRVQTLQDITPPVVEDVTLSRPKGANGPIEITARATDESGLRQAAPYVLQIGTAEREGFLRCDTAAGLCHASLPAEKGKLRLIELTIEDYAGNAAYE